MLAVFGCENNEVSKLKQNILGSKILEYDYFDDCKITTKNLEYSYFLYVECDSKIDEYDKYMKKTYSKNNIGKKLSLAVLQQWEDTFHKIDRLYAYFTFTGIYENDEINFQQGGYVVNFEDDKQCDSLYGYENIDHSIMNNELYPDMQDFLILCHLGRQPSLLKDLIKGAREFTDTFLEILSEAAENSDSR